MYMKLLATLKAKDVKPNAPHFDYDSFKSRVAARAIIFDRDKVALIHVKEHDYYMLPGGGLQDNENPPVGLIREVAEELGCVIEITYEVGSIEVYFDRWSTKQTDYCYVAKRVGETERTPTDFELEEGHDVIWVDSLQAAKKIVEGADPINRDGKLVQARDLLFLKQTEILEKKQR